MEFPGAGRPGSNFRAQLNRHLLKERMIVVNEALSPSVAGRIAEQVTVLASESDEAIQIMMTNVPGGAVEAGLSTYDLLRSLAAPVTVLGSGQIGGGGLLAFVGSWAERRFALPHAQFRFDEPTGDRSLGSAADLEQRAEAAAERRRRVVSLLAAATGQSEGQIDDDLARQRTFDAEAAAEYGLIHRVVQSRQDLV